VSDLVHLFLSHLNFLLGAVFALMLVVGWLGLVEFLRGAPGPQKPPSP
jgi:hypothetical protein